jgi:hypothetical protein
MARGNMKVGQRYCATCGKTAKCERNATVWGLGDVVMVLFTLGAWLLLKFAFNAGSNPWRCSECGARV